MKVLVNKEKCLGCGTCVSICPEVFQLGADGKAEVKEGVDLEKFLAAIDEAIANCPTNAISKE